MSSKDKLPLDRLDLFIQLPFGDAASVLARADSDAVSLSTRRIFKLSVSCVNRCVPRNKVMFVLHVLLDLFDRVALCDVEVDDEALKRFPILVLESWRFLEM